MENENFEQSMKYLDSLDIGESLWSDRAVSEAMEELEAIYGDDYTRLTGNDSLFEGWSEEDFANYIRANYGLRCYERSILFVK